MKFNMQFIKSRKIFFIIAAVAILAGIASMIINGISGNGAFYLDIDFAGGTEISYTLDVEDKNAAAKEIEAIARETLTDGDKINVAQSTDNGVVLKSLFLENEEIKAVNAAVAEKYTFDEPETNNVSPTVSADLRNTAVISTIIAVVLMLLYITIRFQLSSALAAVACLCHDVLIVLAAYSILRIPVSSNIIAVLLTILGYSINATIIIFDRIRENVRIERNATFAEKVNKSINQTFMRSVNTTLTTLFTIGMIYILGVQSIKEFALPLIVGIIAGLFSSVCLAGNFWILFKRKNESVK